MGDFAVACVPSSLTLAEWTLGDGDLVMLRPGSLPSLETLLGSYGVFLSAEEENEVEFDGREDSLPGAGLLEGFHV